MPDSRRASSRRMLRMSSRQSFTLIPTRCGTERRQRKGWARARLRQLDIEEVVEKGALPSPGGDCNKKLEAASNRGWVVISFDDVSIASSGFESSSFVVVCGYLDRRNKLWYVCLDEEREPKMGLRCFPSCRRRVVSLLHPCTHHTQLQHTPCGSIPSPFYRSNIPIKYDTCCTRVDGTSSHSERIGSPRIKRFVSRLLSRATLMNLLDTFRSSRDMELPRGRSRWGLFLLRLALKERVFVILKGQFTHHFPCKIDHIMTRLSEGMSYSKYMNVRLPSLLSFHPSCPLGCWFWFTYWSFLLPNHCNDQLYTVSYNYCTSSRMNSTSGGEALGNTGGRSECWFWALLSGRLSLVNTTRGCPTIFGVSCKLMPAIFR